jgi:phage-related minor tail protein
MEMRPDLQIQTVIKAMMEDVIPALDPNNQLAQQAAQLTIGTLTLVSQHLPLEYRFDCDELQRLLELADQLKRDAKDGTGTEGALAELTAAAEAGADVIERAKAEPSELLEAIRRLRAAGSATVTAVFAKADESTQQAVQATVLASSKHQLLRDRSWLIMQGWEPNPKNVPPIDQLLAPISG